MKVLIVNAVCGFGGTGRICLSHARDFEASGNAVRIGNRFDWRDGKGRCSP